MEKTVSFTTKQEDKVRFENQGTFRTLQDILGEVCMKRSSLFISAGIVVCLLIPQISGI